MRLRVLDLCSGLGGFSQAFVDAGDEVTRVDNDPRFKKVPFTVIADVRTFDEGVDWDVILASPPCTEFSQVTALAIYKGYRGPRDIEKGMDLVRSVHRIQRRHPTCSWFLENVKGSVPHISKELGRPSLGWCGRWVWSNRQFSWPMPVESHPKPVRGRTNRDETKEYYGGGLSYRKLSAQRSLIPHSLSQAVRDLAVREKGG